MIPSPGQLYYEDETICAAVFGKIEQQVAPHHSQELSISDAREFLARQLELSPLEIALPQQVHGDKAARINDPVELPRDHSSCLADTDALWTTRPNTPLVIRTADCLPLFLKIEFGDRTCGAGIIHAGWRGLANGIIGSTIRELESLKPIRQLTAMIGPHICAKHYEVGPEVADLFPEALLVQDGRTMLNLAEEATRLLTAQQHFSLKIESGIPGECTFHDNDRFFSHRRGDRGRNLNIIFLKSRA